MNRTTRRSKGIEATQKPGTLFCACLYVDLWNAPESFEFPDVQKLTSIQFDGSYLTLTWHQGQSWLVRDRTKD